MTKLIAVVYPNEATAERALGRVKKLSQGNVITLLDAVIVTRHQEGGVKLIQSLNITALGAVSGGFWGGLVGMIFLVPLAGAALGAAAGAAAGYFQDFGINDAFMSELGAALTPGSAALFLLSGQMAEDKVAAELGFEGGKLFYSSLSGDTEAKLRAAIEAGGRPGVIVPPVVGATPFPNGTVSAQTTSPSPAT